MPRDNTMEVRPESFGAAKLGIFDPEDFEIYCSEEPNIVGVYRDGIDIRHVTLRNFEPGQETPLHVHEANAHCIYVLKGSGLVLTKSGPPLPIQAGQFLIVPRQVPHGLRNTGNERLTYLGVNAGGEPRK